MSNLTSTLREASDKNTTLLTELAATDYAPSSLKQNTSYIADLKSQISNTDKELTRLHGITEDERKDHVNYRDSTFKRWTYKLGGSKGQDKFTSRQEKEEKEFMEAWQKERSAKESREELSTALQNAESQQPNLQTDSQRHEKAQAELDALYNSIFSGPTPDVSEEDQLEEAVQRNKQNFENCQNHLTSEHQALQALSRADQSLQAAYSDIQDALRRSTRDMLGGGTFTDMMERDALAKAQNNVHAVIRHMDEAQRRQPAIKPLSYITIDQGHMFSDVLFDNIFTDMAQHDRIQASEAQMQNAMRELQGLVEEQNGRTKNADRALQQAGQELENARMELQRIRAEAFERLAGGQGVGGTPPPAYSVGGGQTA